MPGAPPREEGHASPLGFGLVRLVVYAARPFLARLRIEGIANVPREGPALIAINHAHWTDIILTSLKIPRVTHYMAKIELFQVPFLGWLMRLLGSFAVRRGERDRMALETAERLLRAGELVVVFPEGHRSPTGVLGVGHPGAALIAYHTGVPVVPAAISGTQWVMKGLRYGPFAPRVTLRFGKPFRLVPAGKRVTREELARATDLMMQDIAALLPPESRGQYGVARVRITRAPNGSDVPSIEFAADDTSDRTP